LRSVFISLLWLGWGLTSLKLYACEWCRFASLRKNSERQLERFRGTFRALRPTMFAVFLSPAAKAVSATRITIDVNFARLPYGRSQLCHDHHGAASAPPWWSFVKNRLVAGAHR